MAATAKRTRRKPETAVVRGVPMDLKQEIASLRGQVASELAARNVSGVKMYLGDIAEEQAPNLKSLHTRIDTLDRMANDPQVRGQLRAITMTMLSGIRWKVVGGSARARALVEANLLRKGPRRHWMATSFLDFLFEQMGCLIHGFSAFGVEWARPVDGRHLISRLAWLHPRTIDEDGWVIGPGDEFLGIRRSWTDGMGNTVARQFTPSEDLFLTCWDRRGPNWEGNAFIRPMFRPWVLGEMAEKIDIIDLQNRGVGIPVAKLSGAGGKKERDTLVEILKSLRGGSKERAFIVLEKEEEVNYLLSQGQAKDATGVLEYHRAQKVKAAGTEYFEQGNTATGSRAGASALATGFFINVDGIRVVLQDQLNHGAGDQPGVVERLVDRNFGPDEEMPEVVGSRVSPTEQLDNVPLIQDAIAKGVIPPNRKHANEMLDRLGWPELTEDEWDEATKAKTSVAVGGGPLGPGSPADGGPGRPPEAGPDEKGRDDADGNRLNLAEKKTADGGSPPRPRPASWPWLRSIAG